MECDRHRSAGGPRRRRAPAGRDSGGFAHGSKLLVRSNRSSLNALRPRLEVLATQAAFTLERIRLNKENIRHTSESYFRTLVQNSTDVILIVDDDNRIRYASPSAGSVFGTIALTGVELPGLVAQGDRDAAERLLMRARAGVPGTLASEASTPREMATATRLTSDGMVVADVVGTATGWSTAMAPDRPGSRCPVAICGRTPPSTGSCSPFAMSPSSVFWKANSSSARSTIP